MDKTTTPYVIRVSGRLGPTTLAAFPELVGEARGSETILAGNVSDCSALYGIIARLEALGLELIEVRPLAGAGIQPRRGVRGRNARGILSHLIGRLRDAAGSARPAGDCIRSRRAHHYRLRADPVNRSLSAIKSARPTVAPTWIRVADQSTVPDFQAGFR